MGARPPPFAYLVHVVPKGRSWTKGHERFVFTHPTNLLMAWREAGYLELCFDDARIYGFQNRWESGDVQDWRYIVYIKLVQPAAGCAPGGRSF